jgi:alpha-methylacyl-CoA racemase
LAIPEGAGPLAGVRVVELAGLGAAPFCGMVLADLGADVIRVDRSDRVVGRHTTSTQHDLNNRGKRSIGVDLKHPEGVRIGLRLADDAELLIEGFRPGVAERLGIGPAQVLARNHSLVYGRMTGWGQDGPLAGTAGHDIDYIALSGALHAVGTPSTPLPPANLVGDYGGGGMLLAVGLLAGLIQARSTGEGQVVDAAMLDGSALLTTSMHGYIAEGFWTQQRGANLLDGGAPFYSVYETADGGHMAVGAIEPQFFAVLLEALEIPPDSVGAQSDRERWPEMRSRLAARFLERSRDEWAGLLQGLDACVAPVLTPSEAPRHRHNMERGVFVEVEGLLQPAPAPRFSGTPASVPTGPVYPGRDTDVILASLGLTQDDISKLRQVGAVA